jgi:hypothetical protein
VHLAATVAVVSFLAGCVPVPAVPPVARPPTTQPLAAQPPAVQAPPTAAALSQATPAQSSAAPPAPTPSAAAPAAELLARIEAFEDAYNRHDVEAAAGLLAEIGCLDWGAGPRCGSSWFVDLLRYDAALRSELELGACRVEGNRVTCEAVRRDDCLAASSLGEAHYAPVVFSFLDGKIAMVKAVRLPEDAQRDLLFLYSLAGWAQRTRPAEWVRAGRADLLDKRRYPPFDDRAGAAMSTLCVAYAAATPAATSPAPASAPRQTPAAAREPGRVLFIGDSFSLGLDALLPVLAASGQPPVTLAGKLNWHPSAALGVHYELGSALDDIRQGNWDVVVLQDDLAADWPARAGEFTEYARKLHQTIVEAGAETVFSMVHPYRDADETTTEEIAAAYGKIGQELGARVAPVALAFQRSLRERPDLDLYAVDGKHASWAGIYLTGCVLYATITGRSPVGLTYRMQGEPTGDWQMSERDRNALARSLAFNLRGFDWQISEADAADLRRIAWETVQDYQAGR